jgi:hypothetical protein
MAQGVAHLTHSDCARHDLGPWHSEFPKRLAAIDQALRAAAWFDCLLAVEALAATLDMHGLPLKSVADRHADGRVVYALEKAATISPLWGGVRRRT